MKAALSPRTHQLALVLFLLGTFLLLLRWQTLDEEPMTDTESIWKLSISSRIKVNKELTRVQVAIPKSNRHQVLVGQHLYHPQLRPIKNLSGQERMLEFRARKNGIAELLVEYHIKPRYLPLKNKINQIPLDTVARELYLQLPADLADNRPLITLNNQIRQNANNNSELIKAIFHYSHQLISDASQPRSLADIIQNKRSDTRGRAQLMLTLSRMNNIPARLVSGFILKEDKRAQAHHWLQLYLEEGGWTHFDPEKGYQIMLPSDYIAMRYNTDKIVETINGETLNERFVISEVSDILHLNRFDEEKRLSDILDLRYIEPETRETLQQILILPFCVLLTAFLRHVIGLYPYGTFTAPLLSLAMVYAESTITLIIIAIVILLSLLGRAILPDSLSRAPRLSLIFTFVTLSIVFSISLLRYLDIKTGGNIVLIPTIILVSVVDRFYSYMDKSGANAAILRLAVTILIALLCLPILLLDDLGITILQYPEFHLLTAALILLLSTYKGKTINAIPYLRLLGENRIHKNEKQD